MKDDLLYSVRTLTFDENYRPAEGTRATTNFANLARGADSRDNLRNAFAMMDRRFNALAHWDNPHGDRYRITLEIITAEVALDAEASSFPLIEILQPTIHDQRNGRRIAGIAGNNFSSWLRDYDFSILLPRHNAGRDRNDLPVDFGVLHGTMFRRLLTSEAFRGRFSKPPVICLSVSSNRTYTLTANRHPVLGREYLQDAHSLTDRYFALMGLEVRHFMPEGSVAPLAFYFMGDLTTDYTNLELIGTIAVMESFQRIYRPEIYNANAAAPAVFRPSLSHQDYSRTRITYDRDERARLAVAQGRHAEEAFIKPYGARLAHLCDRHVA